MDVLCRRILWSTKIFLHASDLYPIFNLYLFNAVIQNKGVKLQLKKKCNAIKKK